jgi:dienelactone hydrolase
MIHKLSGISIPLPPGLALVLAGTLLLAGSNSHGQAAPEGWLGTDYGPYRTGTVIGVWTDPAREELTTPYDGDNRRVMFQAWFPIRENQNGTPAPYIGDTSLFLPYIRDWAAERQIEGMQTRSLKDVPLLNFTEPFPVLLYSHGGNSPWFTGTAQTEFLASHGYFVISVGHTDDGAMAGFPDGTIYNPAPVQQVPDESLSRGWSQEEIYNWQKDSLQDMHDWHVRDLTFALDQLEVLNRSSGSLFYARLDFDRVGAFGWSGGGATSFEATIDDRRIRAAANLDGAMYGRPVEYSGSTRPLLLLESTDSRFDPLTDTAADPDLQELRASVDADLWRMFRLSSGDWYRARVLDSFHKQFSDFALSNPVTPDGYADSAQVRDITNTLLLEFFDHYLKDNPAIPLLSGEEVMPGLNIIRELPTDPGQSAGE